jgi:hypothetical protein
MNLRRPEFVKLTALMTDTLLGDGIVQDFMLASTDLLLVRRCVIFFVALLPDVNFQLLK